MATIDMNRTTTITLPGAVSAEIWQKAQESSAVMRLARRITLPGLGVTIPIITGDPEAGWVGETEKKPVKRGTLTAKQMTPYTLAVIVPFSNQFRRDLPALYDALVARLPGALAKKFDATVFGGTAPGSNFDTLAACNIAFYAKYLNEIRSGADEQTASPQGMLNWARTAAFGKGAIKEVSDYYDSGRRPLSASRTANYEKAKEEGGRTGIS